MSTAVLTIRNLTKMRGSRAVLHAVDLTIAPGTVTAILGPSGAGKSTLLRAIAGLDSCDSGVIEAGGQTLNNHAISVPPEDRNIGMVFQDFSLFPHLSVLDNVMFGLRGGIKKARLERAMAMLELVHLDHRAQDYPHRLSGGEQQRIALARALAPAPPIILLDEAFSGLDSKLRAELRDAAIAAIAAEGAAAVMVTHDAEEAMYMADTLALMIDGAMVQTGPPAAVYLAPVSEAAARLLGDVNAWRGRVADRIMDTPLGMFGVADMADGEAVFLVRPENITLTSDQRASHTVRAAHMLGHCAVLTVGSDTDFWQARVPVHTVPPIGERVRLGVSDGFYQVIAAT